MIRGPLKAVILACALCLALSASAAAPRQPSTRPAGRIVGGEDWVRPDERRLLGRLAGAAGTCVEFGRDGRRVLTAGGDAARVWDARTFKPLAKPLRHG